jgi:hypothetical protein
MRLKSRFNLDARYNFGYAVGSAQWRTSIHTYLDQDPVLTCSRRIALTRIQVNRYEAGANMCPLPVRMPRGSMVFVGTYRPSRRQLP